MRESESESESVSERERGRESESERERESERESKSESEIESESESEGVCDDLCLERVSRADLEPQVLRSLLQVLLRFAFLLKNRKPFASARHQGE